MIENVYFGLIKGEFWNLTKQKNHEEHHYILFKLITLTLNLYEKYR